MIKAKYIKLSKYAKEKGLDFVEKIKAEVAGTDVETVICAPFTQLKDY
jgi:hypothetical protein